MGLIDFDALLYGPVHDIFADTDAEISVSTITDPQVVPAIDKTAGTEIMALGVEFETLTPAAVVRMSALDAVGITHRDLDGGEITINGKTWTIASHMLRPSPAGETAGEVWLILQDTA